MDLIRLDSALCSPASQQWPQIYIERSASYEVGSLRWRWENILLPFLIFPHCIISREREFGSILFEANICVVYDNFSVYCSSEVSIHFHKSSFPYCCCLPFLTWCLHQDIDRTQRSKKWERVHVRVIEGQVLWLIQNNHAEHLFLTIVLFFSTCFNEEKR